MLLLIFFSANSQETTEISITNIKDTEQSIINNLNNIKMKIITCSDTNMRGRIFKIITEEYKDGELVKTDNYGMTCEDKEHEFEMNGKNYVHTYNVCDRIKFPEDEDEFKIWVALKQEDDESSVIIKYKQLSFNQIMTSNEKYDLRTTLTKLDNKNVFPIGVKTPILSYNPPYDVEDGDMSWYCILDTENPGKWYEDYNIEHFYIIYLLIE